MVAPSVMHTEAVDAVSANLVSNGCCTGPIPVYIIEYASIMILGRIVSPTSTPAMLPPAVASRAYNPYFFATSKPVYPRAFKMPIWVLCSSTILVIVVRLTSAATRKKITGNTSPIAPILSVSPPYST